MTLYYELNKKYIYKVTAKMAIRKSVCKMHLLNMHNAMTVHLKVHFCFSSQNEEKEAKPPARVGYLMSVVLI